MVAGVTVIRIMHGGLGGDGGEGINVGTSSE